MSDVEGFMNPAFKAEVDAELANIQQDPERSRTLLEGAGIIGPIQSAYDAAAEIGVDTEDYLEG